MKKYKYKPVSEDVLNNCAAAGPGHYIDIARELLERRDADVLWLEYSNGSLCGLCANTGVVNTLGITSPAGTSCGIRTYCICPNGRTMKQQKADLTRWPDGRSR